MARLAAKIRAMIVDDEPLARSNVAALLKRYCEIEVVSECSSGAEAVSQIRTLRPDLLFLDIQMPEVDGFDVLEMLGASVPKATIFVTAFDQHALRAFEAGALDYVLKPFDDARFGRALERAKEKLANKEKPQAATGRIAIKSTGEVLFLKLSEIDWIEAADYYVCLHVSSKNHLLRRSMAELEQELDPALFCRIHRSSIVNLERVKGLKLSRDGEYDVVLENGILLPISRRYRAQLQTRLGLRSKYAD